MQLQKTSMAVISALFPRGFCCCFLPAMHVAAVDAVDVITFGVAILLVFLVMLAVCIGSIWLSRRKDDPSPYTHQPLRHGSDLSYDAKVKVLRYLFNFHQYDNRIFEFAKAAVCRETGRIFPNVRTWYNKIELDWSFLQKRYPGTYVSWGSLSDEQKEIIRGWHEPLDDFQTEFSSPVPQPRVLEAKYAFAKPGPLYVDIETKVLLGWQCVPDTDLEVLIVQKPVNIITTSVT